MYDVDGLLKRLESPSSRRAWIEMLYFRLMSSICSVALLAEGVDRNHLLQCRYRRPRCRPPRGGRG